MLEESDAATQQQWALLAKIGKAAPLPRMKDGRRPPTQTTVEGRAYSSSTGQLTSQATSDQIFLEQLGGPLEPPGRRRSSSADRPAASDLDPYSTTWYSPPATPGSLASRDEVDFSLPSREPSHSRDWQRQGVVTALASTLPQPISRTEPERSHYRRRSVVVEDDEDEAASHLSPEAKPSPSASSFSPPSVVQEFTVRKPHRAYHPSDPHASSGANFKSKGNLPPTFEEVKQWLSRDKSSKAQLQLQPALTPIGDRAPSETVDSYRPDAPDPGASSSISQSRSHSPSVVSSRSSKHSKGKGPESEDPTDLFKSTQRNKQMIPRYWGYLGGQMYNDESDDVVVRDGSSGKRKLALDDYSKAHVQSIAPAYGEVSPLSSTESIYISNDIASIDIDLARPELFGEKHEEQSTSASNASEHLTGTWAKFKRAISTSNAKQSSTSVLERVNRASSARQRSDSPPPMPAPYEFVPFPGIKKLEEDRRKRISQDLTIPYIQTISSSPFSQESGIERKEPDSESNQQSPDMGAVLGQGAPGKKFPANRQRDIRLQNSAGLSSTETHFEPKKKPLRYPLSVNSKLHGPTIKPERTPSNSPKTFGIPDAPQTVLESGSPADAKEKPLQTVGFEGICEDLRPEDVVRRIEDAVGLVRTQQLSDVYDSGMYTLLALFLKITQTKDLYRHLLSLQGRKAQSMLDSLQLLLDFPASIDPADRSNLLKALLRLSKRTELYPKCFVLKQVQRSTQALDEGSYGEVFRGRFLHQNVALKIFKVRERSDRSKIMRAVWKEAILWSQLSHDNLLPFYGVYHLNDEHSKVCLVSPWMEMGNVVDYLKAAPTVNRLLLLSDIGKGMAYLHENEIIHGDLKGANILVSTLGRACLADFGLSKISDPSVMRWTSLNTATAVGGTLRWQAPELFTHEEAGEVAVTTKSDIYSFACVCYEIMTGRLPFYQIAQPYTVLMKIMAGVRPSKPPPDDPAYQEFGMTSAIWSLIEECWSQEPAARPTALGILQSPTMSSLVETRQVQQWEGLAASQFRRAMVMLSDEPSTAMPHSSSDWNGYPKY